VDPDPDPYLESGSTDLIEFGSNPDPDLKPWSRQSGYGWICIHKTVRNTGKKNLTQLMVGKCEMLFPSGAVLPALLLWVIFTLLDPDP
jgi:hypothetical protein